jgi:aryl-alcohol dehydrogenase-like predicted oxidoreductase
MTTHVTAADGGEILIGGDLRINRMGFGAMRLATGDFTGTARDPQGAVRVLRRAVELGVDHIDTAGFYGLGDVHAHELIREALSPYDDGLLIATKVGPMRDESGYPAKEATPGELRGLVEDDLRRLGLERFDLVYLRVGGMSGPGGASVADRFAALAALRDEGLIRHLGVSNVDEAQFAEAHAIAPVAAVQNHFHVQHGADASLLRTCEELSVAFVPFFPLGGGDRPLDAARLEKVAARHDATVRQIALAGLLAASPAMALIPGTGTLEHLEENIAAAGIHLSGDDLAELS